MLPQRDATPRRTNTGLLSAAERRALEWIAPRVPRWLTPDRLTALGFAAAITSLAGYLLATYFPMALWLVNAALIVNWLGDSLDGEVARLRGLERPRYGFFLDQSIDVISQLLFAIGLAASGYMRAEIVMLGFATYLMMTVQSLLRAQVTGQFHLATGGMGLTEVRCLLLLANAAFYFVKPWPFQLAGLSVTYADLLGLMWIAVNIGLYVVTLARSEPIEPAQTRRDE
jgi:archaetidylinositol phosphate synthase